jgi:hypothetical protein
VAVDGVYEAGLNRDEAEAVTEAAQGFMTRFPNGNRKKVEGEGEMIHVRRITIGTPALHEICLVSQNRN